MVFQEQSSRHGSELLAAKSFCELFTARCIDVKGSGDPGDPQRRYRACANLDLSLLEPAQRIVVRCLKSFTSYHRLLRKAARMIQCELPGAKQALSKRNNDLLREAEITIDDALEYHPPTSSCSV